MQPSDLPREEKRILARTMAARSPLAGFEIARILGVRRQAVHYWTADLGPNRARVPRGLGELKHLNQKWRNAGIPVDERIRLIEEARRAA